MPSTATTAFVCHATWRDRGLHVWGWDGERPAPAGWLLRTIGRHVPDVERPIRSDGSRANAVVRLSVPVEPHGTLTVSSIRIDAPDVAGWIGAALADRDAAKSDSVIWFGQLAVLAAKLVAAGRVLPSIVTERGRVAARWTPMLDGVSHTVDALHAAAPLVCHRGEPDVTGDALGQLVDAMARQQLAESGFAPPPPGADPTARLHHGVARALAAADPRIGRHPATEVRRLDVALHRARRRVDGLPVAVARLRLDPPDDPTEPWWVQLQLVDDDDPGRWCNAADVWQATPLAVDLAGRPDHLSVLAEVARTAAHLLADELAQLASWSGEPEPDEIPLEVGEVPAFLDRAARRLARLDIELIGPERLVHGTPRLHAVVDDAESDGEGPSRGRLGRQAVIEWSLVVDDGEGSHTLDDASLARAAAAGARLMHQGGRWIRLDPDTVQAATTRLHTLRETRRRVDPAGLLALAAESVGDGIAGGATATPDSTPISLEATQGWAMELLSGLGDDQLSEAVAPESFVGTLRPYQSRGLSWLRLLADIGVGGCLADDMGLGKTATTIAHLAGKPGPHLVVCPLSVVRNWQQECARFAPSLQTRIHHGAVRERAEQASLFSITDDDVVITTYGVLTRDLDTLRAVQWGTVVLDEAQAVKNSSTIAARSVRALVARQKIALTGTPVENRLTDLWAVLDAVNPGLLGSKRRFREEFANPIERHDDRLAASRLRALTRPLVLRRTKSDRSLVPDLPDKIEKVAWATLTDEQAVMYRQVVDELLVDADRETGMRRRGIVLAAITRLKQVCNHPAHALADGSRLAQRSGKLNRLDQLLGHILDVDGQALVFTQYTAMGVLLAQHLRDQTGQAVPFLQGSVSVAARADMVDRFQSGADRVLLISLRAGGTGLNLTAASHVVHYDRWWNPAVENQATDRAWRIGQRRTVMVHKLVTEGTVEERIATVINDKRAVADAAVGHGDGWISEMTTAELARLVRFDPNGDRP